MENPLVLVLCLAACAIPFALGIGTTLLVRRWLPRAAYYIGFLVPVIIPVLLWFLYTALNRASPPCPPNVVSCGEADAYAFILLSGVFLFNLGISAIVQFVLWQILRRKKIQVTQS